MAIVIASILMIILIFIRYNLLPVFRQQNNEFNELSLLFAPDIEKEINCFLASVYDSIDKKPKYERRDNIVVINAHKFDPNQADSLELKSMGLPDYLISNILKYKRKGGIFRNKEKLASIYGMKNEYYSSLEKYIEIDSVYILAKRDNITDKDSSSSNNLYPEKFKEPISVNLNKIDSITLLKIPGVGPATAKSIIDYRERLGGYYCVTQVKDLDFIADTTMAHIYDFTFINQDEIKKIKINYSSVSLLKMHPYINFYQAKCIVDFRKRKYIEEITDLKFSEEFTADDFKRIAPYIDFTIPK